MGLVMADYKKVVYQIVTLIIMKELPLINIVGAKVLWRVENKECYYKGFNDGKNK
jgi:hypothetical protein